MQCGQQITKAGMSAHLEECADSSENPESAQKLVRLRIDYANNARYWIFLDVRADTTLQHLDSFLRKLWLECCGHMSAFRIDQEELAMNIAIGTAFKSTNTKVHYEYDFGSTTLLTGSVVRRRVGSIGKAPVRLLARNAPLAFTCRKCASPATVVCPFCLKGGLFCDAHADAHVHAKEEAYLPVVNSPRMGVCGYTG